MAVGFPCDAQALSLDFEKFSCGDYTAISAKAAQEDPGIEWSIAFFAMGYAAGYVQGQVDVGSKEPMIISKDRTGSIVKTAITRCEENPDMLFLDMIRKYMLVFRE